MKVTCNLQQSIKKRSKWRIQSYFGKNMFHPFLLSFCILWLPNRCAVKPLENCLDHRVIPRTTCLTSLRDWICPKKILADNESRTFMATFKERDLDVN